jgi:NAD(P)-dependent dehydrogenase (short-subunit alcohol dehydrogenase family)
VVIIAGEGARVFIFSRDVPDQASLDAMMKSVPHRRMESTQDVVEFCAFPCSDRAGYVTGTMVHVDVGTILNPMLMRMEAFIDG